MEYLLGNKTEILDRMYDLDVTFKFMCQEDDIEEDIKALTNGQHLSVLLEEKYIERDIE